MEKKEKGSEALNFKCTFDCESCGMKGIEFGPDKLVLFICPDCGEEAVLSVQCPGCGEKLYVSDFGLDDEEELVQ
jgi:predicted RNA-binding Zn-ribbon protein involved in translation (DUF1610 family)